MIQNENLLQLRKLRPLSINNNFEPIRSAKHLKLQSREVPTCQHLCYKALYKKQYIDCQRKIIFPTLLIHISTVTAPCSITTRATLHFSILSTLKAAHHLCSTWDTFFSFTQLLLISQFLAHIFQRTTVRHQQNASVPIMLMSGLSILIPRTSLLIKIHGNIKRTEFVSLTGYDEPHNQHVVRT